MTASDPLLQPYQLKHLTLKNRIMSTSHEPNYSVDGMPGDTYRLYHVEKAKGGIAMTMTAGSAIVSRDSAPAFGNLFAYDDAIVPMMKRLTDDCHEHDCAVMIQLTHLGRRTNWNHSDWLPVLAPSMVREPAHRTFPKVMEDWDIDRIIADYASAAQRMQEAGLDGIEIEAYGHLFDAFWSPRLNQREDEYNGNLENRLRFSNKVLEAIRKSVGPDFIVGLRIVVDEDIENGLTRDDGIEISRHFIAGGRIDFLNVIRGHIDSDASLALSEVIPVIGQRSSPALDFAGDVRAATKFPVFHASKISDVATARHAIAEGKLDMVGMTRAHIADPHIVKKVTEGRESEIRPCVGATYCLDRIYEGRGALCVHNPATGRETTMPHVIGRSPGPAKRIVIVGAGPAGLEAARVSAERGHDVVLFEAANDPGGQIRLAAKGKRRRDLIGIADWRAERLVALGVTQHYNTVAETGDILPLEPDIIIVATGGLPNQECIVEGADLTVSSWDVLSGDVAPGEDILLYDDNGAHPGMQAAEFIAEAGASLEIISPERFFAPDMGGLNHVAYAKCFQTNGVTITINSRIKSVKRDGNKLQVTLSSDYLKGGTFSERRVDQVVVEHGTLALDDLYFDLKERSLNRGEVDHGALISGSPQDITSNPDGAFRLFRIGDAVASRNIHAAIYDALRLCKEF
jgi:2,4-dienoyl-CoA reductase-like NADH-dependent reductase (Old Yellow Enzyme family)